MVGPITILIQFSSEQERIHSDKFAVVLTVVCILMDIKLS